MLIFFSTLNIYFLFSTSPRIWIFVVIGAVKWSVFAFTWSLKQHTTTAIGDMGYPKITWYVRIQKTLKKTGYKPFKIRSTTQLMPRQGEKMNLNNKLFEK